jgi:Brp/Blh family beta-carotene 15,15'-monooxygenase
MLARWLIWHTRLALLVTAVLTVGGLAVDEVGMTTQLVLLATLVALLGLPHGAVDHWQGRTLLANRFGANWPLVFGAGYVAATALVVAAWVAWPPVLLVGFLILAAGHFGLEDVAARPAIHAAGPALRGADIVLRGSLPVLLPMGCHSDETAGLFAALMAGTTVGDVTPLLDAVAFISPIYLVALTGWIVAAIANGESLTGAEVTVQTAMFVVLPPLLAFSAYFCLWHSLRHSLMVIDWAGYSDLGAGIRQFVQSAVLLTALTVAAGLLAWLVLHAPSNNSAATLQVVFIGLAALTVPHVLLPIIQRCTGHHPSKVAN